VIWCSRKCRVECATAKVVERRKKVFDGKW